MKKQKQTSILRWFSTPSRCHLAGSIVTLIAIAISITTYLILSPDDQQVFATEHPAPFVGDLDDVVSATPVALGESLANSAEQAASDDLVARAERIREWLPEKIDAGVIESEINRLSRECRVRVRLVRPLKQIEHQGLGTASYQLEVSGRIKAIYDFAESLENDCRYIRCERMKISDDSTNSASTNSDAAELWIVCLFGRLASQQGAATRS